MNDHISLGEATKIHQPCRSWLQQQDKHSLVSLTVAQANGNAVPVSNLQIPSGLLACQTATKDTPSHAWNLSFSSLSESHCS